MSLAKNAAIAVDLVRRRAPDLPDDRVFALGAIWDEVVEAIIQSMLTLGKDDKSYLHINVRAEMTFQLTQLMFFFTDSVVTKRIGDRNIHDIDPPAERAACFNADGLALIEATAKEFHEGFWRKRLDERWEPKSRKALERETTPRPSKPLVIKPVVDKHFISKWFIRDNWAQGQTTTRWRRDASGWTRSEIPFGSWGYRTELWSDRLEAYFGLLEGDAKQPIEMLLRMEPLNPPQIQSFLAYLVIHFLRNPKLIKALRQLDREGLENSARSLGVPVDHLARDVFDMLFADGTTYDMFARPLLWSRWAMVSSKEPLFVLPDSFCAYGHVGEAFRIIAPLTPYKCFVTLPATETEKPIAPMHLSAAPALARKISAILVQAAETEYLSHAIFALPTGEAPSFLDVLFELEASISTRPAGPPHVD